MSEETPTVDPKHHQPISAPSDLQSSPRFVFRVLIWSALICVAIGVVLWLVALSSADSAYGLDEELIRASGVGALMQWCSFAVPLFAAAGIVAGLGARVAPAAPTES